MVFSSRTGRRLSLAALAFLAAVLGVASDAAFAAERWALTYGREYGTSVAAGVPSQALLFTTGPGGFFMPTGLTGSAQNETAYYGFTDATSGSPYTGFRRVVFALPTNPYDFRVFDPPYATDTTVNCWWTGALIRKYLFEFHWRRVAAWEDVQFFPYTPAYHYDNITEFNTETSDPPHFNSDRNSVTAPALYHAQVFNVPQGINRIIEAKAYGVRGVDERFRLRFSIHELAWPYRPWGPQIGPAILSRELESGQYHDVLAAWNLDDIPVTAGERYGFRVQAADGQPISVYATDTSYYPSGHYYIEMTEHINRDLIGVLAGAQRPGNPAPSPTPGAGGPLPRPVGANLLTNPGFEQSSDANHPGWINNSAFRTDGRFPDPIAPLDGNHWASLSYGQGGTVVHELYQTVNVSPGGRYGLSALHFSGGGDGTVRVGLQWKDGPYGGVGTGVTVDSETWTAGRSIIPWTRLTGHATPTGNQLTFILRAEITGYGGGTNFDQCTVTVLSEKPAQTPTPVPPTATPTPSATPAPSATPTPTATPAGPSPTPTPDIARFDFNNDGVVDHLDLLIFSTHWHETSYLGPE